MFFRKFVKGISGIKYDEAEQLLIYHGIDCNYWRQKNTITNAEIKDRLTEDNLIKHLNRYSDPLPVADPLLSLGKTYGEVTPFISTSAGAIQRDAFNKRNIIFPPFMTALRFATRKYKANGFIFYGYLITIGKKSVELQQFSEEVRELHIYKQFLPYHDEGEIVAKITIPAVQLEFAEEYNGSDALDDLRHGLKPRPVSTIVNPGYASPENYKNISELL